MSNAIFVCSRNREIQDEDINRLSSIARAVSPDILSIDECDILLEYSGRTASMLWPQAGAFSQMLDGSIFLGASFEEEYVSWDKPLTSYPDGTYAIMRFDHNFAELLPDHLASRTIWYYFDDEHIVASTSQRAIIKYIQSFEFNRDALPWILANGGLGPRQSWDARINFVPSGCSLVLDRADWKYSIICVHSEEKTSEEKLGYSDLECAIRETIEALPYDQYKKSLLPLSGGYDSRAILCFMATDPKRNSLPRTVTWGLKEKQDVVSSDAFVAQQLAQYYGTCHQYFETNLSNESIEEIFRRFIEVGEGRTDHISGYMDGFEIWRSLFVRGEEAIIRGDEVFGWKKVKSERDVLRSIGLSPLSDFSNVGFLGIAELNKQQKLEDRMLRQAGETLEGWRDRLYREYRVPGMLAALTQLKVPFCEVVNPLLSKKIVRVVKSMADEERTDKKTFRKIVQAMSPNIHYATTGSTAKVNNLLGRQDVKDFMISSLQSDAASEVLGDDLCRSLVNFMSMSKFEDFFYNILQGVSKATNPSKRILEPNRLVFRAVLTIEVYRMFNSDAGVRRSVRERFSNQNPRETV